MAALEEWAAAVKDMGPFRRHPDGRLFTYAHPEQAEPGEPAGVFVDADLAIRKALTVHFGPDAWSQARRNELMGYMGDATAPVFAEVNAPLIPCLNGVIDLSEPEHVRINPHSPLFGFTAQVPHAFDPDATCPRVEEFLYSAFEDDAEMVQFVYTLIGYSIMPYQWLRKAVMLVGPSGTGKSTLLSLVENLVGPDACSYVSLQALGDDKFAAADLFGKLVNIGGDLDATEIKATGMFKSLTGQDSIRADSKYKMPIRFRSGATMWFACNEVPHSRDHTDAYRERWVVLPLNVKPDRQNFQLLHQLSSEEEMEGLLRHSVEAVAGLMSAGKLHVPETAAAAHANFVTSTDGVQAFLSHAEQNYAGHQQTPDQLTAAYTAWSAAEGLRPVRRSVLLTRAAERFSTNERGAFLLPKKEA